MDMFHISSDQMLIMVTLLANIVSLSVFIFLTIKNKSVPFCASGIGT